MLVVKDLGVGVGQSLVNQGDVAKAWMGRSQC